MVLRGRSDPGNGSGPPRYPGTFLLALREAVAKMNWQIRRWAGDMIECLDAQGREHLVGLENLYRRARREERDRWPNLITEFLQITLTTPGSEELTNLLTVADQLLVRLGPPAKGLPEKARLFSQPLAGTDMVLTLVVDYPNTIRYVTEDLVASSGQPGNSWLERGLANLEKRTPENCFQLIHEECAILHCVVGDAYDASRALLLEKLVPEPSPGGYLVALPGRDDLLVLPVKPENLSQAHLLKLLAEDNYKTMPYAISNEVFWVHARTWKHFPIELRGKEATLQPPPEFLEVLNRLTPSEGSAKGDAPASP